MNPEAVIRCALFTPGRYGTWGLPLLFWGSPGISKTQRIRSVTARCGLPCEVLSPGERGEAAFGVIPVPKTVRQRMPDQKGPSEDAEIDVITNPLPEWALPFIQADGRGVVFVDELTTMPPVVAPAGLGLVDERRIGGRFLGPGVRVLAAANPVAEAASGYDLPPSTANRLGHLDWEPPSVDEWVAWLTSESADKRDEDPADIEARIVGTAKNPGPWPSAFARAKGLAAGFLRARTAHDGKSFLFQMPKPNDPNLSRAWPSPRSWELAVRASAGATVHGLGDGEEAHALLQAFVGEGAAAEFVAYAREADLPSPDDVLDGRVSFQHEKRRPDRTQAVLAACVALIVPSASHKRVERANKLWEILGHLCESDALDLVGLQVKELHNAGLVKGIKAAVPVMHRARPMFVAAGIIS